MNTRNRVLSVFLLGLMAVCAISSIGCKSGPGSPAPAPTASAPTSTAPTATTPTPAVSAPAAPGAAPERTSDVENAIALVCLQKDYIRSRDGKLTGCKVCPKGTDFRTMGPMGDGWGVYATTFGHFTSPADDNLLLSGAGCDSHANSWGGSFLFTFSAGKPKLVRYDQGLITDKCHKLAFANGREFLVCQGGWTGQGVSTSSVFSTVFGAAGKNTDDVLFTTSDQGETCNAPDDTMIRVANLQDIQFTPKETGGVAGMTITAYLGNIKCSVALAKRAAGVPPPGVKVYKIEYLFDGKEFRPTAASQALLNLFNPD